MRFETVEEVHRAWEHVRDGTWVDEPPEDMDPAGGAE